jgi:uncharacterized phage protein (TIGR01671 family)
LQSLSKPTLTNEGDNGGFTEIQRRRILLKYMRINKFKFRAWNKKNKVMTSPDDLFADAYYESEHGCLINKWFANTEMIFMQFTGLEDKDGKEIYEGDIIEVEDVIEDKKYKYLIEHYINCCWFRPCERDGIDITDGHIYRTVLGNIYQNPDILK